VTAPTGCNWTAVSNVPWIGVTSSPNGNGNGTVSYTIDPYTGTTPRPAARARSGRRRLRRPSSRVTRNRSSSG
jgi:hypothetical protein